ncbi:Rod shape-determining protein MreD [Pseudochryseolinea flava]|uniref:Rod shape-determining protein MreD n=1 Tax=Pseudochryseolinea flava TaxID=2059302 RepID=UPI001FE4FD8E|nr:Rod shape-determining protein MreD [Pseudochryseolinea flava]
MRLNIFHIISFFVFLLYQVLILQNVVLFHSAFCFLYILYLLLLPVETNPLLLMGIGFAMGFVVDLFYESLGLHAFACVMVMYARNYWLNSVTPQGGYDNNAVPSMALGGVQWFLVYTMPLIFLHHAMLFYIEAGGFGMFWFTLWKVITSTIFTTLVILIAQFLFPSRRR